MSEALWVGGNEEFVKKRSSSVFLFCGCLKSWISLLFFFVCCSTEQESKASCYEFCRCTILRIIFNLFHLLCLVCSLLLFSTLAYVFAVRLPCVYIIIFIFFASNDAKLSSFLHQGIGFLCSQVYRLGEFLWRVANIDSYKFPTFCDESCKKAFDRTLSLCKWLWVKF